jgi:hypothetical protein
MASDQAAPTGPAAAVPPWLPTKAGVIEDLAAPSEEDASSAAGDQETEAQASSHNSPAKVISPDAELATPVAKTDQVAEVWRPSTAADEEAFFGKRTRRPPRR